MTAPTQCQNKDCHKGWLRSMWMRRIGTENSHGSNLVWRPLKALGATLRALPFKHRFFRCRENNPQHRYNIKVAKHNTEKLNFKSSNLHHEVNECQKWGFVFMYRVCALVSIWIYCSFIEGISIFQGNLVYSVWAASWPVLDSVQLHALIDVS